MGARSVIAAALLGMLSVPVLGQHQDAFCLTPSSLAHKTAVIVSGDIRYSSIREKEPAGVRGDNDTWSTAENLGMLSASSGIQITGTLSPSPPVVLDSPETETVDDGAIHLARDLKMVHGTRVQVHGMIGDGLHGSRGGKTGDYDFYKMGMLSAGQKISIDVDTPPDPPRLDSKVALYDSTGVRLDSNDDGIRGEKDSYLEMVIPADGVYFAVVRGINSWWPGDPFDPASGPKVGSEGPYTLTLGIDAEDIDWYSISLRAGDVFSSAVQDAALHLTFADEGGTVHMASALDRSDLLPRKSPLLKGGNANLALVIAETGQYYLRIAQGSGGYSAMLTAHRAGPEDASVRQVLFIDFDGAELNARVLGGHPAVRLSPLRKFLEEQGIGHDEDAIIALALKTLAENLIHDLQEYSGENLPLDIQNSRDDPDPWGAPNASRIIVGGSRDEIGLQTIGIAESVDVGNFVRNETAVVLLDRITDPDWASSVAAVERAPGVSMADLLGLALGNIIAHEAGHLLAAFHTGHEDYPWQIMDASPEAAGFLGAGLDRILGTADDLDVDFGVSPYWSAEGFAGIQDSRSAIMHGLGSLAGTGVSGNELPPADVNRGISLGMVYPNPSRHLAWLPVAASQSGFLEIRVYDQIGRLWKTVHESLVSEGDFEAQISVDSLSPGAYFVRTRLDSEIVWRKFVVLR